MIAVVTSFAWPLGTVACSSEGVFSASDHAAVLCAKSLQSHPTLCSLIDCNPSGSSVHGVLQARILCPPPGDLPDSGIEPLSLTSPALPSGFFITCTTWEALSDHRVCLFHLEKCVDLLRSEDHRLEHALQWLWFAPS